MPAHELERTEVRGIVMTLFEFCREFVGRNQVVSVTACFDYPRKFRYVEMDVVLPGTGEEVGPGVNQLKEKALPGCVKVSGVHPWSTGDEVRLLIVLDVDKKEVEAICQRIDAKKLVGTYYDEEG